MKCWKIRDDFDVTSSWIRRRQGPSTARRRRNHLERFKIFKIRWVITSIIRIHRVSTFSSGLATDKGISPYVNLRYNVLPLCDNAFDCMSENSPAKRSHGSLILSSLSQRLMSSVSKLKNWEIAFKLWHCGGSTMNKCFRLKFKQTMLLDFKTRIAYLDV